MCRLDYTVILLSIMPLELWPAGCSNDWLLRVKEVAPWIFDSSYHDAGTPQFARERVVDVVEIGASGIADGCSGVPWSNY